MFGLFDKKKPDARPYDKVKDIGEAGYKEAIALLAKASELEWLAAQKTNATIILVSLDLSQRREADGVKPIERVRKMIEKMSNDEYQDWVKTVVFH